MPTSSWKTISDIVDIMMSLKPSPTSIVDLGFGNGKYGFLANEYYRYWGHRYDEEFDQNNNIAIVGVEAFQHYVTEIQKQIYSDILIGDIAEFLLSFVDCQFDLLLLIDVLEHFNQNEGLKILTECKRVARLSIISTPIEFEAQKSASGNVYENHHSLWKKKMLYNEGAFWVFNSNDSNWIAVFTDVLEWRNNIQAIKIQNSCLRELLRLIFPYNFRALFRNFN